MLSTLLVGVVNFSHRFAWRIAAAILLASMGLGWYAAGHFKINTDINTLISADLGWRTREMAVEKGFPQKSNLLVVVVDGETPEAADVAADALAAKIRGMPALFSDVVRPEKIPFFRKNGLLFLSKKEVSDILDQMVQAQPVLGILTKDPSLRGFFDMLGLMLRGVEHGETAATDLDAPFDAIAHTLEANLAGRDSPLSWQTMSTEQKPAAKDLRKLILAKPVLDFTALQPGEAATTVIRQAARELHLTAENGVRVRITGDVALNDEEFASVADGAGIALGLSGTLVFVILLLGLRSLRIVLPILLTLIAGLIATTAFALAAIGSLNLISVAFAVMFIGIAVDFGIQFGVRYRDRHFYEPDHAKALADTARIIAQPLSMAAGSTALGFLAFIPTPYRGVSELGLIAGVGMLIAFVLNVTLLPALLAFFRPPAEAEAVGFTWAAPIDSFIRTHRRKILAAALLAAAGGGWVAAGVRFDFDPLNLKNPHTESVSTLLDAMTDPDFNIYLIDILRPSVADAQALAAKLEKLPEVDHVLTLASFVPEDQDDKLEMIDDARTIFSPTLAAGVPLPPPDDAEVLTALQQVIRELRAFPQPSPSATRLADDLDAVAERHNAALWERLHHNLVGTMLAKLDSIRQSLGASDVTLGSITDDLRRDWVTPDGQALVQVYPTGNPRDYKVLTRFTEAVRQIAPDATGTPVSIQESAHTVSRSFVLAGIYALSTIAALSLAVLRRIKDVAVMMAPLLLAGVLTLATMVAIKLPLNFANIIGLPLLLSLGVSYAIYFVSYARSGQRNPLQSSMARAVFFSAATALAAFGSLSVSAHPGTSGMGLLLTIALVYTLGCCFIVLSALLPEPAPAALPPPAGPGKTGRRGRRKRR